MKRCTKCQLWLPRMRFAAHRYTLDGLQSWCRRCKARGMGWARLRARYNARPIGTDR